VAAGTRPSGFDSIDTAARQAAALAETGHRPWPLPGRPWLTAQTWQDVLFAHWEVDGDELAALLPDGVTLDRFQGRAYIGMTPFRVDGVRLRGTLPLPGLSSFLELNVRTYVRAGGKPGIWFFSLDASSRLAVEAARRLYRLPYHRATVSAGGRGGWIDYASARIGAERPYVFEARYRGVGAPSRPRTGTLEAFLVERYCLYAADGGRLYRADLHHAPWRLRPAEGRIDLSTMAPDGVSLPAGKPLLHRGAGQDVVVWPLEPVT
jgi:uncharacterized protein